MVIIIPGGKDMKIILLTLFLSISSFAVEGLAERAKNVGLKCIPKEQAQLDKLLANKDNPITKAKLDLGKMLYFEPRLSKSGLISCNTCHNLGLGGVDGVSAAIGHKWTANPHHLNSPTVYNSVFNIKQFWDGRSPDLEDQAMGPIQAGPEMAMPKELAVERISAIPGYKEPFQKAFPGQENPITFTNIGKAVAAFERTLVTPSGYDSFLQGEQNALSKGEQKGLETFISKGCTACHNGPGIGGSMMQRFPLIKPYEFANLGDFKGDANGLVKVPVLRNIEETAPYFHNGAVWSLEKAVKIMGETQLGMDLSDVEVEDITIFLKALTGKKPDITYPKLPPSSNQTPKPDSN